LIITAFLTFFLLNSLKY